MKEISTETVLGKGNRYLRWAILGGVPLLLFILVLIFTLTHVPTQTIAAAIPLVILGLGLFIYALVLFVRVAQLLLSDSESTKQRVRKKLQRTSAAATTVKRSEQTKVTLNESMEIKEGKEDDILKLINILSLVEILLTSIYGLIILNYSIFLFNNDQFKDILFDFDASLVPSTSSHFRIIWIFIFYTPILGLGVGVVRYIPLGFWGELVALIDVAWFASLTVALISLILGAIMEKNRRERKFKKEKEKKEKKKRLLMTKNIGSYNQRL